MRLSICIATFNRAAFIVDTLESIRIQLTPDVELLVVDGGSQDGTAALMADYVGRHPEVIYWREPENRGVDEDFDKAVRYASGEYCWLMSDDDLLVPDAVATVLGALADDPAVLIVNAEVRSKDMAVLLKPRQLEFDSDRAFGTAAADGFLRATGSYLTFIGAVVMRRSVWLSRERAAYYGSLFIHVGVIFQAPVLSAKVLARPLIAIRYGNAMWTARGFDIWTEKWPRLVWSFDHLAAAARCAVTLEHPARNLKTLLHYRAIGAYGPSEHERLLAGERRPRHRLARWVAVLPASAVNSAVALYCATSRNSGSKMMLYDLCRASCGSSFTRWIARRAGVLPHAP